MKQERNGTTPGSAVLQYYTSMTAGGKPGKTNSTWSRYDLNIMQGGMIRLVLWEFNLLIIILIYVSYNFIITK